MLAELVSTILLVPASFVVHGRGWFRSVLTNPLLALKKTRAGAPAKVQKGGAAHNFLVYYPMRLALVILEDGSLRGAARSVAQFFFGHAWHRLMAPYRVSGRGPAPDLPVIPMDTILAEAGEYAAICVSLFGGLLENPAITGHRALAALADHLAPPRSFDQIAAALPVNEQMRSFCNARERILVAALPGQSPERVAAILAQKGFTAPTTVYVPAAEENLRQFLRRIAREEGIEPRALLYLPGDAPDESPGENATLPLPTVASRLAGARGEMARRILATASSHPDWDLLWGIAVGHKTGCPLELDRCRSISDFGRLILAPVLTVLVLKAISVAQREDLPVVYEGSGAALARLAHARLQGAEPVDTAATPCVSLAFPPHSPSFTLAVKKGRTIKKILSGERWHPYDRVLALLCDDSLSCHDAIRSECESYAAYVASLRPLHPLLAEADLGCAAGILRHWLETRPFSNRGIFADVELERGQSLEEFLDRALPHLDAFTATGFNDSENELRPLDIFSPPATSPNCAIHLHIHDGALCQEFARYLRLAPFSFDLYVTCANAGAKAHLEAFFNRRMLPGLNKFQPHFLRNRGRDIWPWLEVASQWEGYDLACHIHAKRSPHMRQGRGAEWRGYLLDNLLLPMPTRAIFAAFAADPRLGCVFPAIFPPLKYGAGGTTLYGDENQRRLIRELLRRMGLDSRLARRELLFSAGTMMWYRPQALEPMFHCGLRQEDFPEEPMPLDGTIAHAMERIIPLVALRTGFKVKTMTFYEDYAGSPQ